MVTKLYLIYLPSFPSLVQLMKRYLKEFLWQGALCVSKHNLLYLEIRPNLTAT